MKKVKDILSEINSLSWIAKDDKLGYDDVGTVVDSDYLEDHNWKYFGMYDSKHLLWKRKAGDIYEYKVQNKRTNVIHLALSGKMPWGKSFKIIALTSDGKGPKADEFYKFLLQKKYVNALVTDSQSPGGQRVWQKLNRKKGIGIHGWDPDEEKPINLGKRFDPDETHMSGQEINRKHDRIRMNAYELMQKNNKLKQKNREDPWDLADAELAPERKIRDIQLVAHLREAQLLTRLPKDDKMGTEALLKTPFHYNDRKELGWSLVYKESNYSLYQLGKKNTPSVIFPGTNAKIVFLAVDDNKKQPLVHLSGQNTKGDLLKVSVLSSNSTGLKADQLYYDMLKHKTVSGFITDSQSPGGLKVWQKLNKRRDINIHGWNEDEKKPVNLGKRFDSDETHVAHVSDDLSDKELNDVIANAKMQLVAHLKEDAPTNAASSGAIAGIGIGPQGEPGMPKKKRGKFGNYDTFIVSPNTFLKARQEKRKGKHWRKYLDEDEAFHEVRDWAHRNKGPVILQCERTGAMCFARYGNF